MSDLKPVFRPIQPYIGAEVSNIDLAQPLSPEVVKTLRTAWLKYKVLVFRDQNITREQHLAFGKYFGTPERHPAFGEKDIPEILAIRESPGKLIGEWHTDVTYQKITPSGAMLRSWTLPSVGGDTILTNAAIAYERLDPATKERIATLDAEHSPGFHRNFDLIKDAERIRQLEAANPPVAHPIVTVHPETGEKILFVNEYFTTRIIGLDKEESDKLLARLFAEIIRPEYQMRVKWTPNAIVFWDERATQHYAVRDYTEPRHLDRVTLTGSRPQGLALDRAA